MNLIFFLCVVSEGLFGLGGVYIIPFLNLYVVLNLYVYLGGTE